MAGLPRPARINTCSRPKFGRSLNLSSLMWSPSSDGAERDGQWHRENAGIAENISPPVANRSQPVPTDRRLSRSRIFLQENSLADLEEPSVRQSTLAENQIRIPNESGVTGLYQRFSRWRICDGASYLLASGDGYRSLRGRVAGRNIAGHSRACTRPCAIFRQWLSVPEQWLSLPEPTAA
jgi:hypothetical protein